MLIGKRSVGMRLDESDCGANHGVETALTVVAVKHLAALKKKDKVDGVRVV
jgi:hypothetical protein